ncbi:hypothetical protein Tco_0615542, partial [Tanacetum coccineum]
TFPFDYLQSLDVVEHNAEDVTESPFMGTVRGKCVTQLLLLGALDSIQKKYWSRLKAYQKITILEILFSMLEFSASYNSYTNLRLRMQHISSERPPLNLLRQELAGTCIYLDALQKTTSGVDLEKKGESETSNEDDDATVKTDAEEKLVSFCGQVLKEASDFQSSIGESTNMEIHQVLGLRSPIIVTVLKGMSVMDNQIFKKHLRSFYPLITKLVCCEQMDIRGALAELFSMQLNGLVQ